MPHFIGHSFSDINKWISGKVGLGLREGKEHTALWRIMIDAEVLCKSCIKFDEKLSLGEDTKFINSYFLYEDSIGFLDECFYYLRKRMNGLNMTSQSNPVLMASNKLKLIKARMEIDDVAKQKGYSIHHFWEGTIVFSAVELAIRLSKETQKEEGIAVFTRYTSDPLVRETIGRFNPGFGIKALPFYFLKIGNGRILYRICALIPRKLVKKFTS